jgi:nucleotide-binding universal stress UspA family protein
VNKPHVLVPYDFSAAADLALAWARDYVRAAGGTIHVVHVVLTSAPSLVSMPSGGGATPTELERISADLAQRINERHVNATTELLLSPSPSTAIGKSADEHKATLIVMGTEGRSGIARLALGSVADYLVRNAKCPVVTMRAPKSDDDDEG